MCEQWINHSRAIDSVFIAPKKSRGFANPAINFELLEKSSNNTERQIKNLIVVNNEHESVNKIGALK